MKDRIIRYRASVKVTLRVGISCGSFVNRVDSIDDPPATVSMAVLVDTGDSTVKMVFDSWNL